jgi:Fe-S cluster biosynthesis and repair protein YggX
MENPVETRVENTTANQERIEQFRKMAEADPNNEIGHFSLGRELLAAGQYEPAIASLQRVVQINPHISKAYALIGTAMLKQDRRGEAVGVLTQGVKVADARGDVMPRNEMAAMLKELGAAVPELGSPAAAAQQVGTGEVLCKRCGKVAPKLAKPPFGNAFGQEIFEKICAPCWREAIGLGTKVINELRLPLSDPQAGKIWDQHIREFLNLV